MEMESKERLKINIKKWTCCNSDDIIKFWDKDIDFFNILLDEKLYKGKYKIFLIYDISYKTLTGAKPLRIRFNKTDRFIKLHDKIRYLLPLDYSYYDKIFDKIEYHISERKWYYK